MRRIAGCILITTVAFVSGCEALQGKGAPIQAAQADFGLEPDLYVSNAPTTSPYASAAPVESTYQPSEATSFTAEPLSLTASTRRTHTVAKGDTLFGIARRYYNNASRWKDIYEANRNVLSDPNKLYVGRDLVIP